MRNIVFAGILAALSIAGCGEQAATASYDWQDVSDLYEKPVWLFCDEQENGFAHCYIADGETPPAELPELPFLAYNMGPKDAFLASVPEKFGDSPKYQFGVGFAFPYKDDVVLKLYNERPVPSGASHSYVTVFDGACSEKFGIPSLATYDGQTLTFTDALSAEGLSTKASCVESNGVKRCVDATKQVKQNIYNNCYLMTHMAAVE